MREIPDHTWAHSRPLGRICYNMTDEEAVVYRNAGEDALDKLWAGMDEQTLLDRPKRIMAGNNAMLEIISSTYGHRQGAVISLVFKQSDLRAEAVERCVRKMLHAYDPAKVDEFLAGDDIALCINLKDVKDALAEYGPPSAEWAD